MSRVESSDREAYRTSRWRRLRLCATITCMSSSGHEVTRYFAWPFPGGRFPDNLGAVIQRTILSGELPVRLVVHDSENDWRVGDGVNDPNTPEACVVAHIGHVVASDSSVAELASLPPGEEAWRDGPGQSLQRSAHEYPEQ
jgi:hypothetical protein